MKCRFILCSILTICLSNTTAPAQLERNTGTNALALQYGFGIKVSAEVGFRSIDDKTKPEYKPKQSFRVSLNGGVSSNFVVSELHPSLNFELLVYHSGLGSKYPGNKRDKLNMDLVVAATMTVGARNLLTPKNEASLANRLVPLYYFSNFSYPCLQNPYNYSLSLGSNFIWSLFSEKLPQRVGFLDVNLNKIQISYHNDGATPFNELQLGDGFDRYYTGGGVISYHGRRYEAINLVELSFDKFTGFGRYAFEVSNALDLGFVDYRDEDQAHYNKGLYTLNVANIDKGIFAFVKSYNWSEIDAQHIIHTGHFNSFHVVPYRRFFAFGVQYMYGQLESNNR